MSSNSDVAILVVSCDAYQDLWRPFFHCFFKYWPDCPYPIYLGSNFATYADPRVHTVAVGPDVDYSSNLLAMLGRIDSPWLILWIEDRFISRPIDTRRFVEVVSQAQRQQVGYLKLLATPPLAFSTDDSLEIGFIPKGVPYRVCVTVGLWQKLVLLELLMPGESAWELERFGSARSGKMSAKFFALVDRVRHNPPILDVHGVIKGRWIRDALGFLGQEGLYDRLSQRQVQSMRSVLYVKAYALMTNTLQTYRKVLWCISPDRD